MGPANLPWHKEFLAGFCRLFNQIKTTGVNPAICTCRWQASLAGGYWVIYWATDEKRNLLLPANPTDKFTSLHLCMSLNNKYVSSGSSHSWKDQKIPFSPWGINTGTHHHSWMRNFKCLCRSSLHLSLFAGKFSCFSALLCLSPPSLSLSVCLSLFLSLSLCQGFPGIIILGCSGPWGVTNFCSLSSTTIALESAKVHLTQKKTTFLHITEQTREFYFEMNSKLKDPSAPACIHHSLLRVCETGTCLCLGRLVSALNI